MSRPSSCCAALRGRGGSAAPCARRCAATRPGVDWLFREHWPAAYRAAWLIVRDEATAEDIAQEGFLAALGALERFDRARPVRAVAAHDRRPPRDRRRAGAGACAARSAPSRWSPCPPAMSPRACGRRARRRRGAARRAADPDRAAPPARVHAGRDRRRCSTCRAARSTRGCGAAWTPFRRRWRERARTPPAPGAAPGEEAAFRRAHPLAMAMAAPRGRARRRRTARALAPLAAGADRRRHCC